MAKVLVFGSCNVDMVYTTDHIVAPGETVATEQFRIYPGGKGFNQATALAKAGVSVQMAGCIGEDGLFLRTLLQEAGADVSLLKTVDEKTGQAIIQVDKNGENAIFLYRGANVCVSRAYIDEVLARFSAGDIVLLQNEISELVYLRDQAAARGLKIWLNPSPFDPAFRTWNLNTLAGVVLNETEAAAWADGNLLQFWKLVQEQSVTADVVLTLGGDGCQYWHDGRLYRFPAYQTEMVDTTAAGDTFTGYLIAGLYRGDSRDSVFHRAAVAAALSIARPGAAASIPTEAEVDRALPVMRPLDTEVPGRDRERLLAYLKEDPARADLDGAAKRLGYSPAYCGKWVTARFGMSFSALRQKIRCEQAARWLRETDWPIEEIIARVGYQNGSHFRRLFQKETGMLPLAYRKQ